MSSTVVTWIVIGAIVLLVAWIIMIYNGLVAMRQRVNQAFSDIDVQTKQRHDLIPNLVETVKGYAGHERTSKPWWRRATPQSPHRAAGWRHKPPPKTC
jgi:hypothetical protein